MVGRFARFTVVIALASTGPVFAEARTQEPSKFTAERLVGLEGLGGVRITPDGRWVVVERQGAYDRAATYAYGSFTPVLLADLIIADTTGHTPDRVIGADDDAGYASGPVSPDGRRMAVYRLDLQKRSLGVLTFETGDVAWFGVSPELAVLGRTVAWRGNDEIIAIATPQGDLPLYYRLGFQTQTRTEALWAAAVEGSSPTSTWIPSGGARDDRVRARPSRLVKIHVHDGSNDILATGEFFDLEVSPDGRTAALLANAEDLQLSADEPAATATPTRRRHLTLVDLDNGRRIDPLSDRDLLSHLLSWSPDGRSLLVFGRPLGGSWDEGEFFTVAADHGRAAPVALDGLRPLVQILGRERFPIARGGWPGVAPSVLVQDASGAAAWLTPGTGTLREAPDPQAQFRRDETAVWRTGGSSLELLTGVAPARVGRLVPLSSADDAGARGRSLATDADLDQRAFLDAAGCLHPTPDLPSALCPVLETSERLVAAASDGSVAVTTSLDDRGVGQVRVRTRAPDGTVLERAIVTVNGKLASVDWGQIRPVDHLGRDGQPAKSWLLIPPGPTPLQGWPVVVLIYPGASYLAEPEALRPGSRSPNPNALVLAGAGHAVLMPSLPLTEDDPADLPDLGARIETILDAALAGGGLDGSRVALIGHSFGGRGALLAATQTNRFRTVIASSGKADYGTAIRNPPFFSVGPEDGVLINAVAGYLETGQAAMGTLPWNDPQAYAAASPLYRADRITTPVLIIHADQDPQAAEAMFGALYRLNREAALLTYWGEGHNLVSPANIVDYHSRVIAWLDRYLAPSRETAGPVADP